MAPGRYTAPVVSTQTWEAGSAHRVAAPYVSSTAPVLTLTCHAVSGMEYRELTYREGQRAEPVDATVTVYTPLTRTGTMVVLTLLKH